MNKLVRKGKCLIVAEISSNHAQRLSSALSLIRKAKLCGADAVKFQAFRPETMTLNCANKYFQIEHTKWSGQSLFDLYKRAYTPWNWFKMLKREAKKQGLIFFATAFDKNSVDFLQDLGVPCHKISSFELVDLPLVEHAAKTKKPLILSTGMATINEIKEAVSVARKAGAREVILLKCISSYPARPDEMNLKTISHMQRVFRCPVGLSDHSLDISVPLAAVSLGAVLIEKHFIASRSMQTPDNFFSLEPAQLKNLVANVRVIEKSLGKVDYGLSTQERKNRIFRRSLFSIQDIKKGEIFTLNNIRSIRPGYGADPKYLKSFLGKKSKITLKRGQPLKLKFR